MAAFIRSVVTSSKSLSKQLLLSPVAAAKWQIANISSYMITKQLRDIRYPNYQRPEPFPYDTEDYNVIRAVFDKTSWRFDENSKLIVVDGLPGSGKDQFAQAIAKEFDLFYIPNINFDSIYVIPHTGFDMRTIRHKLPWITRSFEPHDFAKNPFDKRAYRFQQYAFLLKVRSYVRAVLHILSTGQGVVLNGCFFNACVHAETYSKFGFLPKDYSNFFNPCYDQIEPDMMYPHLYIYLNTPAQVLREKLKDSPNFYNSPAHTEEVYTEMDDIFKRKIIPKISKYGEVLSYDCSEGLPDISLVCEDIEETEFDIYKNYDRTLFEDWRVVAEHEWTRRRTEYSCDRRSFEDRTICHESLLDQVELKYATHDAVVSQQFNDIVDSLPGMKFSPGFNPDIGDKVLFKDNFITKWLQISDQPYPK